MNASALKYKALVSDLVRSRTSIAERLIERIIALAAGSVVLAVLLIFVFVLKEAWPVITGQISTSRGQTLLTPQEALKLPPPRLAEYLQQPVEKIEPLPPETLSMLVDYRNQELAKLDNQDSDLNTASWRMMLLPFQWQGYREAEFIWQPNSAIPKYNIVPLVLGSVKIALIAIMIAIPLAIAAAIYVSQLAPPSLRECIKPAIELLAGFPSVVLGFLGLVILASLVQNFFGNQFRLNSLVAGICVALSIIPILFTIAEDAMSAVPRAHRDAALAMGASSWYSAVTVVLPAAFPGVVAAILLAFGRALGETMIALMCSGNASVMSWSIFESARTIPASIGQELAETSFGGAHYSVLFLIGLMLFLVCFLLNLAGDLIIHRLKKQQEQGSTAEEYRTLGLTRA